MQKLYIKSLFYSFAYWIVVLSLLAAGILKFFDPYQFLPSQSFLPVTTELSLFVAAFPLSILEIVIAVLFLVKKGSTHVLLFTIALFAAYLVWSCVVLFAGIEPNSICLERMGSQQNLSILIYRNLILVLSSVVLLKTQKLS